MDVGTRAIRGWHLGTSLDGSLTLTALERALQRRRPEIHHSDQGVQYAATEYVERLRGVGAQLSMAAMGEPRENGHAERLMRTIKEEAVELSEYRDFDDMSQQADPERAARNRRGRQRRLCGLDVLALLFAMPAQVA